MPSQITNQDTQVNTYEVGEQANSHVTALSDGGYVIVWRSAGQDGDGLGIYGQRYDADGQPVGNEFQVNSNSIGDQTEQSVAATADGGFVVAWASSEGDGSDSGVFAQIFDGNGDKVGGEFLVNSYTTGTQNRPEVMSLSNQETDSDFIVFWTSDGQDGSYEGIYGQRFNADGSKDGGEFIVNTTTSLTQSTPSATLLSDGSYVVVWSSWNGGDEKAFNVHGQHYAADGSKLGSEFQVNTVIAGSQYLPDVVALTSGGYVVTWSSESQDGSGYGTFGQVYDANSQPVGGEFQVNTTTAGDQHYSSVTGLGDGGFLVQWASKGQDGDDWGGYAQRFDADGNMVGTELTLNVNTAGWQDNWWGKAITTLNDGSVVTTWHDDSLDGDGLAIAARMIDAQELNDLTSTINPNSPPVVTDPTVDYQVNTETAGDQANSHVAALSDGGYVIVWWSAGQDGDGFGVYGQRYDADGQPVGNEFQVNSNSIGDQTEQSVTATASGGFVVAWKSSVGDGDGDSIHAQVFDANGLLVGSEIQVNTYTTNHQRIPDMLGLDDGDFIVFWASLGQDGSSDGIYGQRFNADGSTDGNEFQVSTSTTGAQYGPSSAVLADGSYVVTWQANNQDGSDHGIAAQHFAADGTKIGGEITVNTYSAGQQRRPEVAALDNGNYVIVWHSEGQDNTDGELGVYGQIFDGQDQPVGSEFRVNTTTAGEQASPSITALSDGGFIVQWRTDQDGDFNPHAQRFDADGNMVGTEFNLNVNMAGWQDNWRGEAITTLNDGSIVTTWHDDSLDGDGLAIAARMIDTQELNDLTSTINPNSPPAVSDPTLEFQINTETDSDQRYSDVVALNDGGFLVTWMSNGQDGDGWGAYAQRYDAGGQPIGNEFRITTNTVYDQSQPKAFALSDGGFVISWFATNDTEGDGRNAFAQRYDASGNTVGGAFMLNSTISGWQHYAEGTELENGNLLFVWRATDIELQLFDSDGNAIGGEITSPFTETSGVGLGSVLPLADNGFILIADDSATGDIRGQRYDANGNAVGQPFTVNAETSDDQSAAEAIILADGTIAVTWQSEGQDGDGDGIYVRVIDTDGNALTGDILVNENTSGNQREPDITALDDGGFLVAWIDDNGANAVDVIAQQFAADGSKVSANFLVPDTDANNQSHPNLDTLDDGSVVATWDSADQDGDGLGIYGKVITPQVSSDLLYDQRDGILARVGDGGFVSLWESDGQDGSQRGVYGQRYDESGARVGAEFLVNSTTSGEQRQAEVSELSDGGFVVVWHSETGDGDGYGVFGRRYDADGQPAGDEFLINTSTVKDQSYPDVVGLTGGGFVAAWTSEDQDGSLNGVYAQRYDANGDAVGAEFRVNSFTTGNQNFPFVGALQDGGFVITWSSYAQDGDVNGVYAQRYDAGGNAVGAEFQVNSTITGGQGQSQVVGLENGGFVIVWLSHGHDGDGIGVFGQIYAADGSPVGDEFQVNSETAGDQTLPAVTALQDGGFFVAWESSTQDPDGSSGIYGQRFNVSGDALGDEVRLNSDSVGSQRVPDVIQLDNGNLVASWQSQNLDSNNYAIAARAYAPEDLPDDESVYSEIIPPAAGQDGVEFQVNTYEGGNQHTAQVAALSGGGFAITWTSADGQDGDGRGAYAQVYGADGNPIGGEIRIDAGIAGNQSAVEIAARPDGGFSVIWHTDVIGEALYLKHYDATGLQIGDKQLLPTSDVASVVASDVDMLYLSDGSYIISWSAELDDSGDGIYAQHYAANGDVLDALFRVNGATTGNQSYPRMQELDNGQVVFTYQSAQLDGDNWAVAQRIYDPETDGFGAETVVNTTTEDRQSQPSIGAAGNGYVIVWQSEGDDDGYGIFGQLYDATGTKIGGEFLINSEQAGGQRAPDVTSLEDGGFLVMWNSIDGQDGDAYGLYAQRYDANGNRVGDEFRLNDTTSGVQVAWSVDSLDLLANGSVVATWYSADVDSDGNAIVSRVLSFNVLVEGTEGDDTLSGGNGDDTLYGGDGDDTIYCNDGHDVAYGGDGNDRIYGGAGNDTLHGGNGADTIDGGAGDDVIHGDDGDDVLSGGEGDDTIYGGAGGNVITGGTGDDDIYVGSSPDGSSSGGSATVDGGDGFDKVYFSGNRDDYEITDNGGGSYTVTDTSGNHGGGSSTVTYIECLHFDDEYVLIEDLCFGEVIDGTNGHNTLNGTDCDDTISGYDGNDKLYGGNGNDILAGGAGQDDLYGGEGNDTILVDANRQFDIFMGGNGDDTITAVEDDAVIMVNRTFDQSNSIEAITANGYSGFSIEGSGSSQTLDFSGTTLDGITIIRGNGGNDAITGSAASDTISGGDGYDVLSGGGGDDTFLVGTGELADIFKGGAGNDRVLATEDGLGIGLNGSYSGDQTVEVISANGHTGISIEGTGSSQTLDFSGTTLEGITIIRGNGGNDAITGSAASDTISGGDGYDVLSGGGGDDTFLVGTGELADIFKGDAGSDRVLATEDGLGIGLNGSYSGDQTVELISADGHSGVSIEGTNSSQTLDFSGTTLDDITIIRGNGGNDAITGSSTDDTIDGGTGVDHLSGGAGNDLLTGGDGNDKFLFSGSWGSDVVTDFDAAGELLDMSATGLTYASLTITQSGSDTLIEDGLGNSILLQGVATTEISQTDFSF